ncbi:hypothetical protein ZWY2020_034853 [Hordeum vulgare]|nr:hypothetical protein ZWY2020_034853 [Hordeum vulgare]
MAASRRAPRCRRQPRSEEPSRPSTARPPARLTSSRPPEPGAAPSASVWRPSRSRRRDRLRLDLDLNSSRFGLIRKDFSVDPLLAPLSARPEHVERALKARYRDAMNVLKPLGRELDLLVAILPDNNGSLYGAKAEDI